jgi:hypothetical protein
MAAAKPVKTDVRRKAVTEPVTSPDQALPYWDRTFDVYRLYVVRVVARKGSVLRFVVWNRATEQEMSDPDGKPFSVDLDDGEMAWSELPSTAQRVEVKKGKKKVWGTLFLTDAWAAAAKLPPTPTLLDGGNGTKIPRSSSL